MKTLLKPVHSLSRLLHDSSEVALGNSLFSNNYDLSNLQLQEEANSFMVSVPVPGLNKDDLNIQIKGRLLVISTKAQSKSAEFNPDPKRKNFKHAFIVPAGIDINRIHAKCRHGLLTITIEKVKSKKSPLVIKVTGKENDVSGSRVLNSWWERVKEKMNLRKLIPQKPMMKAAVN